jgi:thiamine monophosphate synthase
MLTPTTCCAALSALVKAALAGGVRLVQYRNKPPRAALRREQAAEMLRSAAARRR